MSSEQVDVGQLHEILLGRWGDRRLASRALMGQPRFAGPLGASMSEHRTWTVNRLKMLHDDGKVLLAFPQHLGGDDDHGGNIAGYEELLIGDPSLQIKAGVQWGLFAAAIQHLGLPEQQDRWLPGAMHLDIPGSFAMTEIGHGSDVAALATTATFDEDSGEFVIHTPFKAAWKEYIGNAADDALTAVVFAQLITNGINHGVHAFYVPIRDGSAPRTSDNRHPFLPGIGGEDDGLKGGLRGVDNGRLWFNQVRVPRENLLARYGQVAEDGTYSSPINSPGRRFFTMLGSLVQGRVSLDGAAVVASKMALAIGVTYGNQRRQFAGPQVTDEVMLLDYAVHQRRLIPRIAETYAASFAHEMLLAKFHDVFSGATDTPQDREDLETIAAALKATSTWRALSTIQECREACGGAGFMSENRLTALHADLDVYVTFEGANHVLLQLVGKRLLTDYAAELRSIDGGGLAKLVFERAADTVRFRTPWERAAQTFADSGSVRRSAGRLRDAETQHALLSDRVEAMTESLAMALRSARNASPLKAGAVFSAHQNEIVELGKAYADLVLWQEFTQAINSMADDGTTAVLMRLRNLFALSTIERELAWYLINGRMSSQRARAVVSSVDRLCGQLRPHAQDLVDAFGLGPEHLRATIATGVEGDRQTEAREHFREQRARGLAPIPEKK